jgi:hypothetical protein
LSLPKKDAGGRVLFSDVDDASLTLSATLGNDTALPSWLSFDAPTGTFSGTPPKDFDGELQPKVTAGDGALSVSNTFSLDITPVNDVPVAMDDLGAVTKRGPDDCHRRARQRQP